MPPAATAGTPGPGKLLSPTTRSPRSGVAADGTAMSLAPTLARATRGSMMHWVCCFRAGFAAGLGRRARTTQYRRMCRDCAAESAPGARECRPPVRCCGRVPAPPHLRTRLRQRRADHGHFGARARSRHRPLHCAPQHARPLLLQSRVRLAAALDALPQRVRLGPRRVRCAAERAWPAVHAGCVPAFSANAGGTSGSRAQSRRE